MYRNVAPILFGAMSLATIDYSYAREIESWPYDKLFKHAELVVVARAVSTADADKAITDKAPDDCLKPVLTTLEVIQVIKGEHREKRLAIVHYRLNLKEGQQIVNGPMLVKFHGKELAISYPYGSSSRTRSLPPPEYMLFLKKRSDGRYECVSGQTDPVLSVKQIIKPLPSD